MDNYMNYMKSRPVPVGKTLNAIVQEQYLDGTFEVLLKIGRGHHEYLCKLYSDTNKIEYITHIKLKGSALTLECHDFDDDGILRVKIVG